MRIGRSLSRVMRFAGVMLICLSGVTATEFLAPADDAQAPVKYADLQHLQFTATGPLPVKILYPRDHTSVQGPATQVTVSTVSGAGVEVKINGDDVPARNLGKMSVNKDGTTQYDYYGVLVRPGPNTIIATAVGANGVHGEPQTETVFGPGPPVSMHVAMIGNLVADGHSQAKLMVEAVDQWNNPAMPGADVHVSVLTGNVRIGNVDGVSQSNAPPTMAPPTQAPSAFSTPSSVVSTAQPEMHLHLLQGGRVYVPVTASLEPGSVQLQVSIGSLSDTAMFNVSPYLRAPFVNGIISAGAGSVPAAVDGDGRYDTGGSRKERIAVFGTGKAGRASSLTFAYESQNRLQQSSVTGPFVMDPDERPYQTYGDSSIVNSEFHSNDRLFARIDNGRNSLMWGQYITSVGDADGVARYQRQATGVKAELGVGATGQGKITGFNARDDYAYVNFSIPVLGLATIPALHPDIVIGSETIDLVSIDRRTGAVVSQTQLSRNSDYTIDYATGTLRFLNVPLPFDANFNPQVLYVQYQYQGPDVKSQTTGFDFRYALGRSGKTHVDLGYLNDTTGTTNYSLATQTIASHLQNGEWHFSHATSSGGLPIGAYGDATLNAHGSATAFGFTQRSGANDISFNYNNTAPGYANPFGGFSANGLENMQLTFARRVRDHNNFSMALSQVRNTGSNAGVQQTFSAMWQEAVSSALSFALGLQAQRQTNVLAASATQAAQTIDGSNAQLQAGLRWRATKRASFDIQHARSLGGNSNVLPTQTTAEFDYDLAKQGRLYLREMIGGSASSFASSTEALTSNMIGTHSTQIGLARTVGPNTSVDTSYLLADDGNAENIYTTLGVQETFKFGKRLSGNATYQSARATGAGTSGFSVFGSGLTYTDLKDFRASFAIQTRGGAGGGMTMNGGAVGHLGPDFALMGSFNETSGNGMNAADDRVSLAFRPAENDRLISLLGFDRTSGGQTTMANLADVLSFEEVYRPTENTEIAGRLGYKLNGDGFYLAHTSVAGLRVTQNLSKRFDFSAEARQMSVGNIAAARSTDFATELGYKAPGGMRLAGGYNFSGGVDPTLTGHPVRKGFYITVTTLLDRIFGWGKQ